MAAHTPGPWAYVDGVGVVAGPVVVAGVGDERDGLLVAAAPDLAEALRALLDAPERDGTRGAHIRRMAAEINARNVLQAAGVTP